MQFRTERNNKSRCFVPAECSEYSTRCLFDTGMHDVQMIRRVAVVLNVRAI